jgi:hypothetical protein
MGNRRFTRLTNAHSKKYESRLYALAIFFMHYNFRRIHTSLRVTPHPVRRRSPCVHGTNRVRMSPLADAGGLVRAPDSTNKGSART